MKVTTKKTLILVQAMVLSIASMIEIALMQKDKNAATSNVTGVSLSELYNGAHTNDGVTAMQDAGFFSANGKSATSNMTITSLSELYDDEARAKEDIATMQEAGLLDANGKMVDLDLRENGKRVELSALVTRIANGENIGAITVNGNATTKEQVIKISQVSAAIEVAELLNTKIDVTDKHVENLEMLLTGIQNGTIDMQNTLKKGALKLNSPKSLGNVVLRGTGNDAQETIQKSDLPEGVSYNLPNTALDDLHLLNLGNNGESYIAPYFDNDGFETNHAFAFPDQSLQYKEYYYIDRMHQGHTNEGKIESLTTTEGFNSYIDWNHATWGVGSQDGTPVTTVILPLFEGTEVQQWIANTTLRDCTTNNVGIELPLPEPYGTVVVKRYMPNIYFSNSPVEEREFNPPPYTEDKWTYDTARIRYPAYVVTKGDNEKPIALATCFAVSPNFSSLIRRDVLNVYVDESNIYWNPSRIGRPKADDERDYPYVPEWNATRLVGWYYTDENGVDHCEADPDFKTWYREYRNNHGGENPPDRRIYTSYERKVDALGYSYFDFSMVYIGDLSSSGDKTPQAPRLTTKELPYFVAPSILLDKTKYIERTAAYEQANGGFITLTNPENPDFPYLYPGDPNNPNNQYDLELLATEDLYQILAGDGIIYRQEDLDLRFSWQFSNRAEFSFKEVSFSSFAEWFLKYELNNDDEISLTPTSASETRRSIGVTATNGGSNSYDVTFPTEVISRDAAQPFLIIPRTSRTIEILAGLNADVLFSSNIAQANIQNTPFNISLYEIGDTEIDLFDPTGKTPIYTDTKTSTVEYPLSHISIPGEQLETLGNYAVVISASAGAATLSAKALLKVKQAPVKVSLNQLDSYYVTLNNIPNIQYTLTSALDTAEVKYTIQQAGSNVINESVGSASGGTIPLNNIVFEGLKTTYTITVYARNSAEDPWSVDSMMLTVYNDDVLKILIRDVALGDIGGSTGGVVGGGTEVASGTINIDNSSKIDDLVDDSGEGAGYKISNYDFDQLRADVGLQRIISANYGTGTWGIISDKMNWYASKADGSESEAVTINYKENGSYADLRNYSYTSYIPTSDFLVVASDDVSADAPVTITVTHAMTGIKKSINVTVNTLHDKLYLFRFLPKTTTYVYYTNGDGDTRELHTNENGELAVYEPSGINSDVLTMSEKDGETYVGTYFKRDLVSGEKNIVRLEIYPCNNLTLAPISSQVLTILKPDGKPYSGAVTLRAGVYKGGEYCSNVGVRVTKDEGDQILRSDIELTTSNGNVTLYYDPTQLTSDNGLARGLKYVYEYRIEGYQPGYIIADPMSNTPNDFVINLQNIRGGATTPQLIRQEYQQYLNGSTPTSYVRNVIDNKDNIGISANFPRAVLYTDIVLPGEMVGSDENGYSTYEGENVVKFAFYTTDGKKLTGQTDLSSGNVQAMQITNLNDLDTATYFVFPFSAVPMLRSTYVMTDDNLKQDGITDEEEVSKRTARIKAVFNRGEMTVASINMPFGVTNISHQDGLTTNTGAIRTEINNNLKEQMNMGEIFRTINVNDMIEKGFVFLSNLSGAGSDTPISMMILPTADPATFRIIAFVGSNARDNGGDEDGLSFNTDDLAEDISKYMEELKEDDKKKDNESNGEGSMEFNFYGTIILEARVGVEDGKWDIMFRGGSVGTNVKGKYEWGKTFMCGPYPAFINFELGFHADLEVAFGNKGTARAMLLDAALGVSIEAFAGLGFDLSIVALQLGIYGQIGADVNFLLLTPSGESVKTGTKLTISGEIGIKLKVKLLFISYTQKFASTGFNWTKKWGQYDVIKNYWTDQGYGQLFGKTRSGRSYQMLLFADGSAMVAIDGGPEMESRDYLELEERVWSSGANNGMALRKGPMTNALTNVLTNAYPYSHPAFTDDGEMFLYVSDNNNANAVESVVSYAVKNGDGYENQERVDTSSENVLADLDVVASGTKTNAFAAWVKQVESPRRADADAEISNDELGMMFNATEIYTSYYNGTEWTTTRLTDNYVADMSPTIASYENKAIVAWRSMNASSMTSSGGDITTMFDVENNINYSIYNGTEWTTAQVAYNGTAGTVNAIDSAMLSDGTAIIVYTVRTGEDISTTETFYTVVGADGSILTTGRLTNDNYIDTNAQATAVNEDGGYFILGWYSEHDASKESTVAHDIRLARINANGNYDIDFPECVGLEDAGITADFHFSVPANNTKMTNVAIVWSQRMDSNTKEDAGKYELNAVRFFKLNELTGFTAPINIAETTKNYTIDHFDVYTDTDGAVHAIILGSDYNNIEGIDVYDTIDLNAAANIENNNNSDAPNNLDILDGEAISSLKLAKGTFPETAAEVTADINISEVIPGFTTPVQFTVANTGTNIINTVSATVGDENKEFTNLNLLPGKSTTLLMTYSVPAGALSDVAYSLTSDLIELGSGTLVLNRPDVGISGMKIIREENGERDIQVVLNNSFAIPLEGSGKTVKLAFYKDPFHETMIGDEITISAENYAEIDAGVYNFIQTFDVKDIVTLNSDGEIPANGFTVYARAWVEDTKEPNTYNNDSYVSFTGPLARKGVQTITNDTTLEVNTNDQSEVTGYTVYTDIRNNSMNEKNIGIPVALLLDDKGNIIAQKNFQKDSETIMASMTLTAEQTINLSVTFRVDELNGKTPVEAAVGNIYAVAFNVNGGTGTFDSVQTDLEGKIALPVNNPTPPAVQEDEEPLLFKGWFTDATDGELITEETVFTADTTIYAHYVNHVHEFTYSKDGATITATCSNTDGGHTGELSATMTIVAPTLSVYGGTGSAEATVINNVDGVDTPSIIYKRGETILNAAPIDAGTYTANITVNDVTATVEYTIAKKALTITANPNTITYGDAPTNDDVSFNGFVNNEDRSVLGGELTFTYTYEQYGHVSDTTHTYTITPLGYTSGNYEITFVPGVLTVERKVLTITANPNTITYGDAPTNDDVSFNGFVNNEDRSVLGGELTFTYTYEQYGHVSDTTHAYTITPKGLTSDNYDITFVPGVLTVNPKAITVTIVSKSSVYGEAQVTLEATTEDGAIVNDDTDVYSLACTVNEQSNVGSYDIIGSDLSDNYDITFVGEQNAYSVTKKALTVTANPKTITYGDAPTNDDVSFNGFVNNEDESVLSGTLDYDYSYVQYDHVSDATHAYTITPKGLTSDNYDITFVPGVLTVNPKAITVTIVSKSSIYGEAQVTLEATTEDGAIVNDDTDVYSLSCAVNELSNVGNYDIIGSDLSDNYDITFVGEQNAYVVTKRPITVAIVSKSSVYGEAQVTLETTTEDGAIVNDDTDVYSLSCAVNELSNVGNYDIIGSDLSDNYDITFVGEQNAYVVTKRPITVTAEDKTIKYGQDFPTYTFTVSEEISADVLAELKQKTVFSCDGDKSVPGKYDIVLSFVDGHTEDTALTNYKVTLEDAYLYVLSKSLVDPTSPETSAVEIRLENNEEAFDFNISVKVGIVTTTETTESTIDFDKVSSQYVDRRSEISKVYSITLYRTEIVDGVEKMIEIQPSDLKEGLNLIIKIEIPEYLVGRNFRILHIHSQSDIEYVDASNLQIEDGYVYVKINRLSDFAFVNLKASEEMNHGGFCLGWLTLIFDILLAAYFVVYMVLKRKKLLGIIGLGASGAVTIFAVIVLILHICYESIIGLVLSVLLLILFLVFFLLSKKGNKPEENKLAASLEDNGSMAKKESENKLDEPIKENSLKAEETINEPVEPAEEEEVITITDEKGNIFNIRYIKSFTAKLIQSPEETKKYYEELKNYVLSYKKTTSRVSWHYDSINSGRNQVLKFAIRGKTLCLYYPLNVEDYNDTKYKVEAVDSKKFEEVPCLYRIKNDRRLGYAKDLIDTVMANLGLVKGEEQHEIYSNLPYEPNAPLIARGLIKEQRVQVNKPVEEQVIESHEDEEGNEVVLSQDNAGNVYETRYVKSFRARLIEASDEAKEYYKELRDYILSYQDADESISWLYDSINYKREQLFKLNIRGKTLCIYYALDTSKIGEKYKVENSDTKKYSRVPCLYRINNPRRVKLAKELIDRVMRKHKLILGEEYHDTYHLKNKSRDELIKKGLIKEVKILIK